MERKDAIKLQQSRTDYLTLARVIGNPETEIEVPQEQITARFLEICNLAKSFVPHVGSARGTDNERFAPLVPVINVPGELNTLYMRYSYYYDSPEDISFPSPLLIPNEFNEVITRIEIEWLHGPANMREAKFYDSVTALPVDEIFEKGEILATEELWASQLRRWQSIEDIKKLEAGMVGIGIDSPPMINNEAIEEANRVARQLVLVHSSLEEYAVAYDKFIQTA